MARILVAEDEDSVREFLTRAFGHKGHEVTAVADGGQALEALPAQSFDLLLADIVMPRLDGVALALKVGKDFPALMIVLMTGYADRTGAGAQPRRPGPPSGREAVHHGRDMRRGRGGARGANPRTTKSRKQGLEAA